MGQLISVLLAGGNGQDGNFESIQLDFENVKPTPEEQAEYDSVSAVLSEGPQVLGALQRYEGSADYIRKSISNPSPGTEDEAWRSLLPSVATLRESFEYAGKLESALVRVLALLCTSGKVEDNMHRCQATSRQLVDIVHFATRFDDIKMSKPEIQNDFSYYRRTLSKMRMGNSPVSSQPLPVNDELASRLSLFLAHSTPMLKTVIDCMTHYVAANQVSNPDLAQNVSSSLGILSLVTYNAVAKERVTSPELVAYCLKVMIACAVLFDHIDKNGAFSKSGLFNIRNEIKLVQERAGSEKDNLLNALRYTTKHLGDAQTPKSVKHMLGL